MTIMANMTHHNSQVKSNNAEATTTTIRENKKTYQCRGVEGELRAWRNKFDITTAKDMCRSIQTDKYSVAILASGGLLDTLSAIRAGMCPIWGSEIDETMQAMWKDLTANKCYGDAFEIDYSQLRRPTIMKTGFPCVDYSALGARSGANGPTGEMYIRQAEIINLVEPTIAILEQTNNAIHVNEGKEVKALIEKLMGKYVVHHKIVDTWRHGDPSNRKRLFIIAIHRRIGTIATKFKFPAPKYNNQTYPIALDIAIPDDQVPMKYILKGEPTTKYGWIEPKAGAIHHIGSYGTGAGDSRFPHPLQSWYGLMNTQLTTNGGARRVLLTWDEGTHTPIYTTRLTTPIETVRTASLPDTYLGWVRSFNSNDKFLFKCVNNGIPLRTGNAIDEAVIQFLIEAGVEQDIPKVRGQAEGTQSNAHQAKMEEAQQEQQQIRSMLVDTGASGSLSYTDIENRLNNPRKSLYQIAVANNSSMRGSADGELDMHVINTAEYKGINTTTPFNITTTTAKELRTELFSLDGPFREGGWNVILRQPDYEDGISELYRAPTNGRTEARIPLRYDWAGANGGWWMDYIIVYRTRR